MVRFAENSNNYQVGVCLHLVIGFVCSHGKNQNYPCPYRNNTEKCPECNLFTENMKEELKEKGYFRY